MRSDAFIVDSLVAYGLVGFGGGANGSDSMFEIVDSLGPFVGGEGHHDNW